MADGEESSSTNDFGEDLNCSICMQLLFQPLTLLDCLHTFCGACLKDWFAHQAAHARSIHPYTCPSCRASVRDTKRYAFIMTLLEKELKRHPEKTRVEEDKQEHMEKYKPGDNVMPKLRLKHRPPDPQDDADLQRAMDASLREAGITNRTLQPPQEQREARSRGSSAGRRSRQSSRSPAQPGGPQVAATRPTAGSIPSRQDSVRRATARQLEHQASLVSLMSASEIDPEELQEEILRQIAEEGLLDGIDLSNLDSAQHEELSERIARAYQQRSEEQRRRRRETSGPRPRDPTVGVDDGNSSRSPAGQSSRRSAEETRQTERTRQPDQRPPISNPTLIDSANQVQVRHGRTGSSSSSRSAARVDSAIASGLLSASSAITTTSNGPERRVQHRSSTDPDRASRSRGRPDVAASMTSRGSGVSSALTVPHGRQRAGSNPGRPSRPGSSSPFSRYGPSSSASSLPLGDHSATTHPTTITSLMLTAPPAHQRASSSSSARSRQKVYQEPSISCVKCGRGSLEHDIHYECVKCTEPSKPFILCKPCYREPNMRESHGKNGLPETQLHVFFGERYQKPQHPSVASGTPDKPDRQLTEDDPASRRQAGVFCDICSNYANTCYWKCDICNDGDWGFCNDCVNQGRHCTHPLLPLKAQEDEHEVGSSSQVDGHLAAPSRRDNEQLPSPPGTPKSASIIDGPVVIPVANMPFHPLTFHTLCDICVIPIPPSVTRYHCPTCNHGDYDICMNCYHGLISTGKISQTNGPQGWRKCPEGHRMVVIGFQDSDGGQRRVVARDLVGGWTFDESTLTTPSSTAPQAEQQITQRRWRWRDGPSGSEQSVDPEHRRRFATAAKNSVRYPPDGGIGLVFVARWNYFSEDAREGTDLVFPRGAEVREAEDINGDWFWGAYAGSVGLFPGSYVRFMGRVGGARE